MPCISKTAYHKQLETILDELEQEAKEEMTNAAKEVHESTDSEKPGDDGIVDAAVSFDGTWAKRGFTSLTGVVFVISVDTGKVLDYHCLSKFCQKCSLKKSKCKDDTKKFQDWQVEHIASGECDINFEGSSPAMECEGAVVLWKRSIEKNNMHYKWMVSDGDSKAHSAVEDIYGENCKVEKLDCVGHVQKRMAKHLMKLKATNKSKLSDGKTIGGKGRLTEGKIKQLQKYYGLAIRQNTSKKANPTQTEVDVVVYKMKNIIAILHHSVHLKDPKKQHRYCPRGESSWCKWQQDQSSGTSTYDGSDCLPEVFLKQLTPTFLALSEQKLLERCVCGATQNANECLNSLVLARCPKHKNHGIKFVRCAVASAVCHFHSGAATREKLLQRLSTPAGEHTRRASLSSDKKRLRKSDLQATHKEKKRRQGEAILRTQREEALCEAEGVTYEAGGF